MEYDKSKLIEVAKLFMDENDAAALKKLYKITEDDVVKILLYQRTEYEDLIDHYNTYAGSMYADILDCIWKKYDLSTLEKEVSIN